MSKRDAFKRAMHCGPRYRVCVCQHCRARYKMDKRTTHHRARRYMLADLRAELAR